MIVYKAKLSKKEHSIVSHLISELTDIYRDFYITKDNIRLFIKENIDVLFHCLSKGDKIAYGEEGIAFVTGFSDKSSRKYLKILAKDEAGADRLLKVINWNIKCILYIKIKRNNPIKKVLEINGFKFFKSRGKEILLRRKGVYNANKNKKQS